MKPAPSTIDVVNHLSGRSGSLTLDEDSLAHIMDMLTNIYSDSELAVIREYASNAWDSHKDAGQTRPIEITLPNDFDSVYKVRDYGVGMSADEIMEIYSKYGRSTKRETDDEIGMLGIGCKSALTYVDQFTLRCVKDGERVSAVISRNIEGGGEIHLTDPVETDEPNGVEVSVAVVNPRTFNQKAREFFSFWNPNDVLINGDPPDSLLKGLWIDDDVLILDEGVTFSHHLFQNDLVVMGGVPYPLPREEYQYYRQAPAAQIVAFVPIGSVDPAPSREALKDTERTTDTVHTIRQFVMERLHQIRQNAVNACETPWEARELVESWALTGWEQAHLTYRGRKIKNTFFVSGFRYFRGGVANYKRNGPRGSVFHETFRTAKSRSIAFIDGFTNKSVHPKHRERLEQLRPSYRHDALIFFVESMKDDVKNLEWINPAQVEVIPWETVKAVQLPKPVTAPRGPVDGRYEVYERSRMDLISADDISTTQPLYYVTTEDVKFSAVTARSLAHVLEDNAQVVFLQMNRINKFLRLFPNALHAPTVIKNTATIVQQSLSPIEEALQYGIFRNRNWKVKDLDSADVIDPDLKHLLKDISNADYDKIAFLNQIQQFGYGYLLKNRYQKSHKVQEIEKTTTHITNRYPLLARAPEYLFTDEETLEYINAIYLYRYQEG